MIVIGSLVSGALTGSYASWDGGAVNVFAGVSMFFAAGIALSMIAGRERDYLPRFAPIAMFGLSISGAMTSYFTQQASAFGFAIATGGSVWLWHLSRARQLASAAQLALVEQTH
ncbi:MAG: hypothetical protein QM831_28675 [Kofleriaceae bacterium]